jgi:centrosomal CEP192-like protein/WD40 repeat protein/ASPM-SPD-2-Hydin domain-containing protein
MKSIIVIGEAIMSLRSIRCLGMLLALLACSVFAEAQKVKLSAVSLAFGKQVINVTSASKNITLTNTDTVSSLAIQSIVASGNFAQTNNCGTTLAPGTKCTITVTFTPTVAGAITGEITLEDNAANSPQLVGLTGTGVYPLSFTPTSLNFGLVAVGNTSAVKTVTLTNNRSASISLSFSASGNFAVMGSGTTCAANLVSKATCTIAVTFTPTTAVAIKGALTLSHTAAFSPQEVGLTGAGTGTVTAPLKFSPTALSFSGVVLGTTSAAKTATITNSSTSAVTINSISVSSVYAWAGSGSAPCKTGALAAGAKCTLAVTYAPTVAATDTGAVTVSYTGSTSPQMLGLTGKGLLPVTFTPTSLTFAAQAVGVTSPAKTVTLTNNQSTALTIDSVVASGQYAVVAAGSSPCDSSVPAKGTCTIGVTFTPVSAATIKGVITIAHNALFSPQEIKLTGTGKQSKVAFVSGRATGDVTALPYIMNIDGSGVTPLPYSGMPSIPRGVTVSPDDSKVLTEIDGNNPTQVYTAKLDGTALTQLTTSKSNRYPRWSPDGKQIVFISNRDGGAKIYLMNADGSSQTRLSPLDNTIIDLFPSFSPNGKQIVFIGWDATVSEYAIWTMSTDGSNRKSVLLPHASIATPAFSPDGNKILWVDNGDIASVNLDGAGRITLTNTGGRISELMILGTEVWFTTSQDGNLEVYKMNADGSGQENMTNDPYGDALGLNFV